MSESGQRATASDAAARRVVSRSTPATVIANATHCADVSGPTIVALSRGRIRR
jgi:hypothetical protein